MTFDFFEKAEHEDFEVWPQNMSCFLVFFFFKDNFKISEACAMFALRLSPRCDEAHTSICFKNGLCLTVSEAMACAPLGAPHPHFFKLSNQHSRTTTEHKKLCLQLLLVLL